jgi:iron(III) transport system substrate-binding protein
MEHMNSATKWNILPSRSIITVLFLLMAFQLLYPLQDLKAQANESWRVKWEQTVEAANREGRVNIYYWGAPNVLNAGVFQKAFPGIKVVTTVGVGGQLMQRILTERRADKQLADIYIAGITTMPVLQKAKALDPIKPALILPEVLDESKWWGGKHHYGDPQKTYILTFSLSPTYGGVSYNTNLVNPRELKSYWDLLKPKWKGKIGARDLRRGGPGTTSLRFFYYNKLLGPKYVKRLFGEMDVTLFRNNRQALDWLGTGRFALAFFPLRVAEAKATGLPVDSLKLIMKEGVGLSSRVGYINILNKAPHPNAAKVFLNWFFSREGQATYQRSEAKAGSPSDSLRIDIAKDYIPVEDRRTAGIKYLDLGAPEVSDPVPVRNLLKEVLSMSKRK